MSRMTCTTKQLEVAWRDWISIYNGTDFRFGQYVIFRFGVNGIRWPELFYCEDNKKAYEMVLKEIGL